MAKKIMAKEFITNPINYIAILTLFLILLCSMAQPVLAKSAESQATKASREIFSLDEGWLFHLGDIPMPEIKGHGMSYNAAKAGNALGAAALEYDDSDWRKLNIPHDWAVEGPFDPNENVSQGYRPRGISWYRKYLRVDAADRGKHFELELGAIATHATIWFNGNVVAHNWSGYNSINIDLTPYIRYDDALNTLAIRVDAKAMEGWWYEGAGIYRHAWLIKTAPTFFETNSLKAVPQLVSEKLDKNNNKNESQWLIPVSASLNNVSEQSTNVTATATLYDENHHSIAQAQQTTDAKVLASTPINFSLSVNNPALWSLDERHLYQIEITLAQNNQVIDRISDQIGFRKIRFDSQKGFFLNDQHIKLKGICMHQDHAGVGVAIPDAIWEYRLRRLKELGVNAIRFSHNAPAKEVLAMTDRMGFLVMDENRNFNPSPDYLAQLQWMVKRDVNHPSIILWSVFNEEPVQDSEQGYEMVRRMVAGVKAIDESRPVTAAMNGGMFKDKNVSQAVDVVGFNYQVPDYDKFHALHPNVPFTSSEDTSAFMTRGEFTTDNSKNVIASYDDDFAPWGNSHRDAWEAIDKRDYVAGGFVWTGFDYRGEPTPNLWPSVSSVFGIMDLNGFPKTAYYLHQVQWIKDKPLIYIAPHWNWNGQEGKNIRVMVMTNTESIQLKLNGTLIGEQKADPYRMNYFDVPYQPGKLEAVGFNQNKSVATALVETTGKAVALQLIPDRKTLLSDGDAMPITVQAVDEQGRVVPDADNEVALDIYGAGISLGHGNGDPNSHEDEKGKTRKLFHGLAQLIVQSKAQAGEIKINAQALGLRTTVLKIPVVASPEKMKFPVSDVISLLHNWRVSPASAQKPDVHKILADNDMNSWEWGQVPMKEASVTNANWRLFRTYFSPRADMTDGKAQVVFTHIQGKFEIWLDDQLVAQSDSKEVNNFSVKLPAGKQQHRLDVLLQAEEGKISGIDNIVKIQR